MATNFVQPGSTITLVAPTNGVLSGQPVLVGSIFGVCNTDAKAGDEVEVTVDGVWELGKAAGELSQGDPIYYATTTGLVGDTGAGLFLIGVAVEGAATDAATVRVRLNGVSVSAVPGT